MSYPKPLSSCSLEKLYASSGLSEEQIHFLQVFFQACANLYGIAPVAHLWDVYKEYAKKQKCPKIRKKDLVVFAGIVRREVHNYEVYRYDEIYPDEVDSDLIVVLGRHCQLWAEEVVFL